MTQKIWEQGYTQNRELSWLQFNARVLAEAEDENVPLLERFKFLAIFTSNLDEFFMIRVGSLCDMAAVDKEHTDSKSGLTGKEQLHLIYKAVEPLYARRDAAFSDVDSKLSAIGLRRLTMDSLAPNEQKYIKRYFKDIIAPVLSPQIVDSHHPFPHLEGKVLHIAALLSHKKTERLGLLPVPASLPPVVFLPETPSRYILTEDILLAYADHVFEMYDVLEKTVLCVTRNADIDVKEGMMDHDIDYREIMTELLKRRRKLAAVRLQITPAPAPEVERLLCNRLLLTHKRVFDQTSPLDLSCMFKLAARLAADGHSELCYPEARPMLPPPEYDLTEEVQRHDVLLAYPYQSMKPFIGMLEKAAADPDVVSIKMTLYRMARESKIVEALTAAGAELVPFSPVRDPALPEGVGGLYLPGGYPELYARQLSENSALRVAIRKAVQGGLPTAAECGGFLYLGQTLEGTDGTFYPMAAVLPGSGHNAGRLVRFGYAAMTAKADSMLFRAREALPIHEFHHWDSSENGADFSVRKTEKRQWECGFANAHLYAGFPHLYWAGTALPRRFVQAAQHFLKHKG